jgi:choline transport protein
MLAPIHMQQFLSYLTDESPGNVGCELKLTMQYRMAYDGRLAGVPGLGRLSHRHHDPGPYRPGGPELRAQSWHGTLLMWAVVLFCVSINTVVSGLLPKFEAVILFLHILGFFAILIPLVVLDPHADPQEVFNSSNEGMWPIQGLSFMIGLLGNVFAFFGADGAIHMSEEIVNAQFLVPRSILLSVIINGSLGFGMIIAVLFCLGNLQDALTTPTGYPFIEIF